MAKDNRPQFDPRFDPAFQRGYKPKPGEAVRVRQPHAVESEPQVRGRQPVVPIVPVDATAAIVSATEPVETAHARRTAEPDPLGIERDRRSTEAAEDLSALERDDYLDAVQRENPDVMQTNVYIVVLWIVGIVFTVVGFIVLVSAVYALVTSSPIDAFDRTMDELGIYSSAPLMTVGLATLVGLLFLAAVRSRGRKPR